MCSASTVSVRVFVLVFVRWFCLLVRPFRFSCVCSAQEQEQLQLLKFSDQLQLTDHWDKAVEQEVHRCIIGVHLRCADAVGNAEANRDDGQEINNVVGILQESLMKIFLQKAKARNVLKA